MAALTAAQIEGKQLSHELRGIATAVSAGTATAAQIQQTNISIAEKAVLESVRAGTATRESIMAAPVDMPLKEIALAKAGV